MSRPRHIARCAFLLLCPLEAPAQYVEVRPAAEVSLPPVNDGNSPSFWADGRFHMMQSTGVPAVSHGENQFQLTREPVYFDAPHHSPVWFEAAWRDDDGTLFLWYHHEPGKLCGSGSDLTAPKIGAAISYDNGRTVKDLGIVLESGDAMDCNARNGFFGSGHGDFSVIPDRERKYFYFLFTNYGGDVSGQGVAIARLAFEQRFQPVGEVYKYHNGEWTEPGLRGRVTPVFPTAVAWQREDTDSFWGAAVHWNTSLQQYVVLLNRACCKPRWPMEGAYIAFNPDIANPAGWTYPAKILSQGQINNGSGYYAQVIGLGEGETDTLAGEVSRLYVHGVSRWELVIRAEAPAPPEEPNGEPEPPENCLNAFCTADPVGRNRLP